MQEQREDTLKFPDLDSVPVQDKAGIDACAASFEAGDVAVSHRERLQLAVSMVDLTTLEGADTPDKVRAMCEKALRPSPSRASIPHVAAVCVYPTLVGVAAKALQGTPVRVASVAGAFPSGQAPLDLKLSEIRYAVSEGADEIDIVISRGKFLDGHYREVFDEIAQSKEACGAAHLKVILETGELQSYDHIRIASELAMAAGADFIKTSTGKISPAATLPATLVMLNAILDYHQKTGRMVGMKPAGGIRSAAQAMQYLSMLEQILGEGWMTPEWFRFGASSLLDDLVEAYPARAGD
ncbi:deoxyribose-phosphate aldolase [Verrucomicrobiaceae bacterium N1E253]|uniref:Deoxyribose-phosphate aldolase n=1 Tax=Oceaniferula marina TaxID=2748318 RepID=A0A851GQZ8_9BACT|nr:deoxyribose-phosphate aldolase [Oceaniferula marina]NWK56614.1 deoxyribose-phosphate aldolase [Oceaniferula marina]